MHRFADKVLAHHRAKPGPPVARPRVGRPPRTLQLDVPANSHPVDDLAQQDGASVPESGNPAAELVAGIDHRQRRRSVGNAVAGQDFDPIIRFEEVRINPQLAGQLPVDLHQLRFGN